MVKGRDRAERSAPPRLRPRPFPGRRATLGPGLLPGVRENRPHTPSRPAPGGPRAGPVSGSGAGPWDIAALVPIVREAGGSFSDLTGQDRFDTGSALFCNGRIHEEALDAVRAAL